MYDMLTGAVSKGPSIELQLNKIFNKRSFEKDAFIFNEPRVIGIIVDYLILLLANWPLIE